MNLTSVNDKKRQFRAMPRRRFLRGALAVAALPCIIPASAIVGDGRPAPSNRLTLGCIGVGGRGTSGTKEFLAFNEVQVVAVCDVRTDKRDAAKRLVDAHYNNQSCAVFNDFRELLTRPDIDMIKIATPDHWHALMTIAAMRHGKDVFCEKPETLTIREGRELAEAVKLYGRVFSGGSQRVWSDYNWFHRMVRGGAIGEVREVWFNAGGPSKPCTLPAQPVPPEVDWDMWLGPAPWAPYNRSRLASFRTWRDYSGGGMTDWGAHCLGGALFACGLHETGPTEIIPPNGKEHEFLTYRFANGIQIYHAPNKVDGRLRFKGTQGDIAGCDTKNPAPNIFISNYKGTGGLPGDFLHCVRTRQQTFRNIEVAHRTATACHLGNIAYWLNRPLKWDPVKEQFIGDDEANRWLARPKRSPWHLA
jgi:predicted dehydrogenase